VPVPSPHLYNLKLALHVSARGSAITSCSVGGMPANPVAALLSRFPYVNQLCLLLDIRGDLQLRKATNHVQFQTDDSV
jgi:hypothetical protein